MSHVYGHQYGHGYGHRYGHFSIPAPIALGAFAWWDWRSGTTKDAPEDPEINAWMARIGGYAPVQAVAAEQPKLRSDHVEFDGGDVLSLATSDFSFAATGRPGASDYCVYELLRFTSLPVAQQTHFALTTADTMQWLRTRVSTTSYQAQMFGDAQVLLGLGTVTVDTWYWSYYGVDGSTFRGRLRGESEQSSAATTYSAGFATLAIGDRRPTVTNRFFGLSKSIVVLGAWPTAAQHAQMQAWADVELGYA